MGITLKTSERELNRKFKEAQETMLNNIVRVLRYCGEMAVNEARNNGNYKDQTGNLRNSIGYVICVNGRILDENFNQTAAANQQSTENGLKIGRDLALQIAKEIPDIALIVVAGMKYASHVESRGINVLTSAENLAKRIIPDLLKQLQ